MNIVTYKVQLKEPTDHNESRWVVTNLVNRTRVTVPFSIGGQDGPVIDAVRRSHRITVPLIPSGSTPGTDTYFASAVYAD